MSCAKKTSLNRPPSPVSSAPTIIQAAPCHMSCDTSVKSLKGLQRWRMFSSTAERPLHPVVELDENFVILPCPASRVFPQSGGRLQTPTLLNKSWVIGWHCLWLHWRCSGGVFLLRKSSSLYDFSKTSYHIVLISVWTVCFWTPCRDTPFRSRWTFGCSDLKQSWVDCWMDLLQCIDICWCWWSMVCYCEAELRLGCILFTLAF